MSILNIRLGLATNSSSSHSLVWVPRDVAGIVGDDEVDGNFGWNNFTCASEVAKKMYIGVCVAQALRSQTTLDEETRKHVLSELLELDENCTRLVAQGYCDHQSLGMLDFLPSLPELLSALVEGDEAFNAFCSKYQQSLQSLMLPHWVVVGGNDNDGLVHPLKMLGIRAESLRALESSSPLRIRKDEAMGFISVFNPNTGAKIRVALDTELGGTDSLEALDANKVAAVKSSVPELADIKITDYCPYACAYCYQGSTVNGAHADYWFVSDLARELGRAGTFEVAIGGGEPTLHPDFVAILEEFRDANVVPNFTTRNLSWLRLSEKGAAILAACGSFAVSVENAATVQQLASLLKEYPVDVSRKAAVQLVMGTLTRTVVREILAACAEHGFRVTLLGYKRTGRGIAIVPEPYDWWLEEVISVNGPRPAISIDTALAAESNAAMRARGIDPRLYHLEEGKFSMYFDAVNESVAPSSYCGQNAHQPYGKDWLERFAQM